MSSDDFSLPNFGLCGYLRSGKSTVADYLQDHYGYTRLGFAVALKEEVARGVGCEPKLLDEEPLRSQIRPVLQVWGTDFRRGQDPEYWLKQAEARIDAATGPIVFDDVRFLNEVEMLRAKGFLIIKIDMRLDDVLRYAGSSDNEISASLHHRSEREWQSAQFDGVIPSRRGDVSGLLQAFDSFLLAHLGSGGR